MANKKVMTRIDSSVYKKLKQIKANNELKSITEVIELLLVKGGLNDL